MHFAKDKSFYKTLFFIAVPIALQNLITFGINMMDTVMLGQLGDTVISASSLAGQPFFIFTILTYGIAGGASVLSSQYWGKGDVATVRRIVSIALRFAMLCSVVFTLLILLFPEAVMRIYTKDPKIIEYGADYLRIVGYIYLFFGISNTFVTVIRSMETVAVSVVSNIITFATNVFFNWIFIFGALGAPALGIKGAAIGTLIARIVEFCILTGYALIFDKKLRFRLRDLADWNSVLIRDFFRYSVPVILNELMWAVGASIQAMIFGRISEAAVAANSIVSIVQQLATITIFGVANAAAVMVGKAIGAGDNKRSKEIAFTLSFVSMGFDLLSGVGILLLRDVVVSFYNVSDQVKLLAGQLMIVTAVIVFFISLSALYIVGVLRGAGDSTFNLAVDLSTLWLISVPLGILAGLVLQLPVPFVYLFFKMDEPAKVIFCLLRLKSGKWIRNVTRESLDA